MLHVIRVDDAPNILTVIMRLKSDLTNMVEPYFGLLDQLLSLEVLTRRQYTEVHRERTACDRNYAVLDLLESEDQCNNFVKALQRTGQQHIVNFVTQNGGEANYYIICSKYHQPVYCLNNLLT